MYIFLFISLFENPIPYTLTLYTLTDSNQINKHQSQCFAKCATTWQEFMKNRIKKSLYHIFDGVT